VRLRRFSRMLTLYPCARRSWRCGDGGTCHGAALVVGTTPMEIRCIVDGSAMPTRVSGRWYALSSHRLVVAWRRCRADGYAVLKTDPSAIAVPCRRRSQSIATVVHRCLDGIDHSVGHARRRHSL
jgi:hypothetical protein